MARRVIAHMDLDAFYASVELRRRPELRGLPVIVSHGGPRSVVTTATYEARAHGVRSGVPTARALRLCPQALRIDPDFPAYRAASREVWAIVAEHVDTVEQVGLDEAYLDLSELVAPRAAMRRVVAEVRRRTGLGASVGIGPNRLVAKVASDCEKPLGMVALSREMACERFADSPPSLVPGIGPKTAARLDALGIHTLRALRDCDEAALAAVVGAGPAANLRRRAAFHDDAPVGERRATRSQSCETTFDVDLADRGRQLAALLELCDELARRLTAKDMAGRTVGIKVRLADWTTVTRVRTLERPTCAATAIRAVASELLLAYDPPGPVRLLGVRVAGLDEPPPAPPTGDEQLRLALS